MSAQPLPLLSRLGVWRFGYQYLGPNRLSFTSRRQAGSRHPRPTRGKSTPYSGKCQTLGVSPAKPRQEWQQTPAYRLEPYFFQSSSSQAMA